MTPAGRGKLACVACTKRKIKCDKTIPCDNCVKRGERSACRREANVPVPTVPLASAFSDTPTDALTTRVNALESTLSRLTSAVERLASNHNDLEPLTVNTTPQEDEDDEDEDGAIGGSVYSEELDIESASTVIEFLAWGRRKINMRLDFEGDMNMEANAMFRYDELEQARLRQIGQFVPDRHLIDIIVDYYCQRVLWYDGAIYQPTFKSRVATFLEEPSMDNSSRVAAQPLFAALLFGVLSSGLACASDETILEWSMTLTSAAKMSQDTFQSALTCLELGDYLAKPSLYSVQCIAALTLPGHLLGHSTKQSTLLATAIKLAQTLNLHQLGKEVEEENSCTAKEEGRRVWCQLCTQDFFQTPFSETNLVNIATTTTEKPRNSDDNTLKTLPDTVPTQTSFVRFKYELASLLPRLEQALSRVTTAYARYEQVVQFDSEMRKLVTESRPPFLGPGPIDSGWPRWVPWARRALRISCAHKIIMVHRKFISLSFVNSAFTFTRQTCIAASKTILKSQKDDMDPEGPILWIEHAFVVTACVILSFDLLYRPRNDNDWQQLYGDVADAIAILTRAKRSKIASRGVRLLTALLQQIEKSSQTLHQPGKRSRDGHGYSSAKRQRFNTTSFVDGFLREENKTVHDQTDQLLGSNDFDDLLDLFAPDRSSETTMEDSLNIPWDILDGNWSRLAAIAGSFSPEIPMRV